MEEMFRSSQNIPFSLPEFFYCFKIISSWTCQYRYTLLLAYRHMGTGTRTSLERVLCLTYAAVVSEKKTAYVRSIFRNIPHRMEDTKYFSDRRSFDVRKGNIYTGLFFSLWSLREMVMLSTKYKMYWKGEGAFSCEQEPLKIKL